MLDQADSNAKYWDALADDYQNTTRIAIDDFHFGPLLPGNRDLELLPPLAPGSRCLEIGCGAGQNSLYLASLGHHCTALDVSAAQLNHGRRIAAERRRKVDFRQLAIEDMPGVDLGLFDLVHSTFAMPFATDPVQFIDEAASRVAPGGHLVLTTAHPLFAGDYLQDEDGLSGIFLTDYFDPPPDIRHLHEPENASEETDLLDPLAHLQVDGDEPTQTDLRAIPEANALSDAENDPNDQSDSPFVSSRAYPIGLTIDWLHEAGLQLVRLMEPRPMPIPIMHDKDILHHVPYDSPAWRPLYEQLCAAPVVAIFIAVRPK